MGSPYDYQSIGLGISFEPQLATAKSSTGLLRNEYHNMHYPSAINAPKLELQSRSLDLPSSKILHYRAQSAVVPQRATFEQHDTSDSVRAPRSAHPLQRPFPSSSQRFIPDYSQSSPVTPDDNSTRVTFPYSLPRTDAREQQAQRETVQDRRQRRHMPEYSTQIHQYSNVPQYMNSPIAHLNRQESGSSHSGSSYLYMSPSVGSTPYSDAGNFPVSDTYGIHSQYDTPNLMHSPVFEQDRQGRFDEHNDMPEDPYVPTVMTNFPPLRPSALRRNITDESRNTLESHDDARSVATSPASSESGGPSQKEKKVAYSRWTSAEDLLLKDAIASHGDGKWSLVSQMVPGRTPMQCSTRWQGALNTTIHKGRWDPEEDAILIKSVAEWQAWHLADNKDSQSPEALQEELYKNIPWSNIAQLLPRPRTGVQALARWSEALDPRITKGKWTTAEDTALLRGISKYGKCWIKIANCVKGRTQRQCRTRYCQISDKKRRVRGGPVRQSPEQLHFSE
ncbi:protein of unknown function [Taphrina deformans PYCC 5710]|uniref:Uncharacterized protein n=1 Tax=Taphrina deformans (strain PYCC 5710 / ATCC 11124 / CBS 356.35 / IMI 108563 / JCM 9778 / NBRC 8474) TaxID=1097556 RepID=R4XJJ0_TAPDE|nr:protein of unknown function [Taphrina deformans PYCC 5710]|eukprot:CCG84623.1 protein of unknown function [Taphrina deformans PYCC 5710]